MGNWRRMPNVGPAGGLGIGMIGDRRGGHEMRGARHGHHPRSPRQAIAPERMPPPPSKRARHPLVIVGNAILTLIVLMIVASGVALYIGKGMFEAPGPLDRERTVIIPRGAGIRDVAQLLRRERIIDNPLLFVGGAVVTQSTGEVKAGEYLFEPSVSMREVLDTLVEGRSIEHTVTIPEGLTSEQIVARLMENPVLTGDIAGIPPEGSLLPETYKVTRGTTRQQLLNRMISAKRRLVQETWDKRAAGLPIKTIDEFVTLASIVEKETGKTEERPRVAAVFINRLNRRMRLQSDPTIIYGMAPGKGTIGRPLTRADVERPTAYNTYAIEGLPPGPIANPGRASLEAVANPARTKDLYFVADGTGGHVFAATYNEHLKNVARWRQYQREQAAAAAQEESSGETQATSASAPTTATAPAAPAADAAKGAKRAGDLPKSTRAQ
jgi:UPF0755 protein